MWAWKWTLLTPAIIDLVLSGAVVRAVQALHTHFPAVLSAEHATASSSNGGAGPSVGGATAGGTPAGGASNGNGESLRVRNGFGSSPVVVSSSSHAESHATPVFIRSSDPDHVRLNLQIQEFIESFRQLPSSAPSSPASSLGSLNGSSASNSQLTAALAALQDLHTAAKRLRSDHRAVYLQEIKDVGALFAYVDPENSPVKGFLDQARRIALAQQVNAAILRASSLQQLLLTSRLRGQTGPVASGTGRAKNTCHLRDAERPQHRPATVLDGGCQGRGCELNSPSVLTTALAHRRAAETSPVSQGRVQSPRVCLGNGIALPGMACCISLHHVTNPTRWRAAPTRSCRARRDAQAPAWRRTSPRARARAARGRGSTPLGVSILLWRWVAFSFASSPFIPAATPAMTPGLASSNTSPRPRSSACAGVAASGVPTSRPSLRAAAR